MRVLYQRFQEAREREGKKTPSYDKFLGGVTGQIQALQKNAG